MKAAQNNQRWAVDQRKKARFAAAARVRHADDTRREEIANLQRMAAMMERLPAMAESRARVLERIVQLQATFVANT